MLPFDFSFHKTFESFSGNGSTRVFAFTEIPALTKTDIQISIFNNSTKEETLIAYDDFSFVSDSTYVGFTITLGEGISTPQIGDQLIGKLVRPVKNEAIFSDGSSPTPKELTVGYQALCLSIATLFLNAQQSGITLPISDIVSNVSSLTLPLIDTNLEKLLVALRKNTEGKYELYYDTSVIDNTYNTDIIEVADDYSATSQDNVIVYTQNAPSGKKINLYNHLNVQDGYYRNIEIRNLSEHDLAIYFNDDELDICPSGSICEYKIGSSGVYSIVY